MKNYYFDENGVYTGSALANPGTITPENALRIAPDQKDGYWPVLNENKTGWDLALDYRGKQGRINGCPTVITSLGPLPDNWDEEISKQANTPLTAEEQRCHAYAALTDHIRDTALSYQLEAEACRKRGDADGAGRAMLKYNRQLSAYLDAKTAIRKEYPHENSDNSGEDADADSPSLFLGRSGIFHTPACGFARGNGEWLGAKEIWARGDTVRPCRRCRPAIGG